MQDSLMPASDADEFDLIDLLIPIIDNIKLLIGLPILVAICAWAYTMNQPLVYESTSLLRLRASSSNNARTPQDLSSQQNALYESALLELTSSDVLAILLESPEVTTLMKSKGLDGEAAYNQLRQHITPFFEKKAALLKLTTRADKADSAQILNQKLVEVFVKFSLPKGHDLESLKAQFLQTQLAIKLLETEIARNQNSKANAPATSDLMIQLLLKTDRLQDIQNQIGVISSEVYVQRPTYPQSGTRPQQKTFVAIIFFATFFILLIFIFLRLAWINYSNNPENSKKVIQLRQSLGLPE